MADYLESIAFKQIYEIKYPLNFDDNDLNIFKNLFLNLDSFKNDNVINDNENQQLSYLLIFLFDYVFLKTFFQKYYDLADGFNINSIHEIEYGDKNIHPDVVIAFKISESLNKYIGISRGRKNKNLHIRCWVGVVVLGHKKVL